MAGAIVSTKRRNKFVMRASSACNGNNMRTDRAEEMRKKPQMRIVENYQLCDWNDYSSGSDNILCLCTVSHATTKRTLLSITFPCCCWYITNRARLGECIHDAQLVNGFERERERAVQCPCETLLFIYIYSIRPTALVRTKRTRIRTKQ